MNENPFYLGLSVGQAQDYSALCILEQQGEVKPDANLTARFHCRHLQRWPLKTPYPQIVAETAEMVGGDSLQKGYTTPPVLVVDGTGVGEPVLSLFRREKMRVTFEAVQLTAGDAVTTDHHLWRVPKRDLISAAQVALQTERLKISPRLREAATLTRELQNFQVKINLNDTADSYMAWREGASDDMVLSVCLALWSATRPKKWLRLVE